MTFATKYRISQTLVVVCIIGIVVSLSRMVPAGLAGDVPPVKFWFGALVAFLVIGISATFAYYYYRDRRFDVKDQQQIAVETLAKLGEQRKEK